MPRKSKIEVYVHFTWTTVRRTPLIVAPWETLIHGKICEAVEATGCRPIIVNGVEDHIHLLVALASTVTLSKVVTQAKSISTLVARDAGYEAFAWQHGYGAFSVGWRNLDPTIRYIQRQKQHHARRTTRRDLEQFNHFDETDD